MLDAQARRVVLTLQMMARLTHQATTAQEAPPTPDNVCWVSREDRADDGATWTAYRADDVGSELAPPVAHPDGSWRTEGIVARPRTELRTRGGARLITKIKCRDFLS